MAEIAGFRNAHGGGGSNLKGMAEVAEDRTLRDLRGDILCRVVSTTCTRDRLSVSNSLQTGPLALGMVTLRHNSASIALEVEDLAF
jgi:hypothetical protein